MEKVIAPAKPEAQAVIQLVVDDWFDEEIAYCRQFCLVFFLERQVLLEGMKK